VLSLIGNLSPLEIVVVGVLAILIFGKRLPEVASRALYQLRRLRRSMEDMRRETGIDREIRSIERSVQQAAWEAEARAAREVERESSSKEEGSLAGQEGAEEAKEKEKEAEKPTRGPASP